MGFYLVLRAVRRSVITIFVIFNKMQNIMYLYYNCYHFW